MALRQFQDHLVVASKGNRQSEVAFHSHLAGLWKAFGGDRSSPSVRQNAWNRCVGTCMRPHMTAMGVSIHVGGGDVFAHAHPDALGPGWQLKLGVSLQSSWAPTRRRICNAFSSALCNMLRFVSSWSLHLISSRTYGCANFRS